MLKESGVARRAALETPVSSGVDLGDDVTVAVVTEVAAAMLGECHFGG